MDELLRMPVRELLNAMRAGDVSSVQICTTFLDRLEQSHAINAVVFLDRAEVLNAASEADARRQRGATEPLLGIPFSVKDSIAVAGWPWRSGSYARADVTAEADATAVARLRAAGAIPLCKTATPEYTWSAQTHSALHGRTCNPYDLQRSPGGSSGGEAAVHAVRGAPFGLGTDGFTSIRVPAHFCGTAGLRPTAGVVSEWGTWPTTKATGMMDISTTGPMGRFAEDLDLLLDCLAGPDPRDPFVHPLPRHQTAVTRVGVLPNAALGGVSPGTVRALQIARDALADQGAQIVTIEPWSIDTAVELAFALMAPDGGRRARENLAAAQGRHTEEFANLLDSLQGGRMDIDQYLQTVQRLTDFRAGIRLSLAEVDIALAPVAAGSAPLHDRLPGSDDDAYDVQGFAHAFAIALAGVPSVVVPMCMEGPVPVGIQVIGSAHTDYTVLRAATDLQRHTAAQIPEPTAWAQ